ncbi:MAG: hypothetical protein KKA71_11535, partial [Proteobacteria bacterium]|nr:hypothetical protein [Pseudomonadota bacterium]
WIPACAGMTWLCQANKSKKRYISTCCLATLKCWLKFDGNQIFFLGGGNGMNLSRGVLFNIYPLLIQKIFVTIDRYYKTGLPQPANCDTLFQFAFASPQKRTAYARTTEECNGTDC